MALRGVHVSFPRMEMDCCRWGRCLGHGHCAQDKGWGGGERPPVFLIYTHSSNDLGESNPNKLSEGVLDLIPGLEAAP